MRISGEIEAYIVGLEEKVRFREQHYLLPGERLHLYNLFEAASDGDIRGWLAIIAAEYVLPIFEQNLPEEKIPRNLLHLANQVERGIIPLDSWRVQTYSRIYSFRK
jgi:hypothetical protein